MPGTDPAAARVLETCRRSGRKVRLMSGDTATGRNWLEEYDVVGCIACSAAALKLPVLIETGDCGGQTILTNCLLRIIDWDSGRDLYRHPAFRTPQLTLVQSKNKNQLPWQVLHEGTVMASFRSIGKACAYLAFMCGETVEPRVFQ